MLREALKYLVHRIDDRLARAVAFCQVIFGETRQLCFQAIEYFGDTTTPAVDGLLAVSDAEEAAVATTHDPFGKGAEDAPLRRGSVLKFIEEQMANAAVETKIECLAADTGLRVGEAKGYIGKS